jgi:hypothetical protein
VCADDAMFTADERLIAPLGATSAAAGVVKIAHYSIPADQISEPRQYPSRIP